MEAVSKETINKWLDEFTNQYSDEAQKGTFDAAIEGFLSDELSPLMARSLIHKYKKIVNISRFEGLPRDSQINITETIIKRIFSKVKTPEQINMLRLNFYIKLSVTEASKKLSQLLGREMDFNISNAKTMSSSSILEFVEMLDKEVFMVRADLSNFVEGTIYVLLFKDEADSLGQMMLEASPNTEEIEVGFSILKISALQEFVNMTLSSYADAIANIMNGKLFFTIQKIEPLQRYIFVNDVKETIFLLGTNHLENIYICDIIIEAGSHKSFKGIVLLILKRNPEAIQRFLAEKQLSKIEFNLEEEQEQAKESVQPIQDEITIKKIEKNIKMELAMFMDDYFSGHDGNEIIEFLMQDMNINDLNSTDAGTKQEFANRLLDTAFKGLSIYRQGIIKSALYDALGINEMVGGERIEARKHEEMKEEKKTKESDSNIFNLIKKDEEK